MNNVSPVNAVAAKPANPLKILLYVDSYNDRVGQSLSYVRFFSQFGEVILITSENTLEYWITQADVLALPGGADVDSKRYGEKPDFSSLRINPHYEYLDEFLLMEWMKTKKPIIGICRGLQTLNVAAGGSLYQDINGHNLTSKKGDRADSTQDLYTDISVTLDDEQIDFFIHNVNSFHHQAIKRLAEGFDVLGWGATYRGCPSLHKRHSDPHFVSHIYETLKNGDVVPERDARGNVFPLTEYKAIIEIIRHRTNPWIAFQYHPEDFNDTLATCLIWDMLVKHQIIKEAPFNVKVEYKTPINNGRHIHDTRTLQAIEI